MLSKVLKSALLDNHIKLAEPQFLQMLSFLELLQKWNKVFNLTAIRDISQIVPLHIVDSLIVSPYLHGQRILDVGTGAGFPGVPLAIFLPDIEFTLLDSSSKKINF